MNKLFTYFLTLTLSGSLFAQTITKDVDINDLFKLEVDSIEQRVTINKWGNDTSYYLHYKVKNTSSDTLTFKTNTCFYYNHSILNINNLKIHLNPEGGCYFNSHNIYKLAPNESFIEAQWITAYDLNKLVSGEHSAKLNIPILKNSSTTYRIDGRWLDEIKLYLTYEGEIKVVNTVINKRKRKKKTKKKNT